jgi:mono/diheme cytochrome c family protein
MRDPAASGVVKHWTIPQGVFVAAVMLALIAGSAILLWPFSGGTERADPDDRSQTALGRLVYAANCASCHGDKLQGQPNWQEHKPDGKLPAPPHDASGHTWHHPDSQLFDMVKRGLGPSAPAGYRSDMPAFNGTLNDKEIWAVLAFIKSAWPPEIRERQSRINQQSEK